MPLFLQLHSGDGVGRSHPMAANERKTGRNKNKKERKRI